MKRLLVPVVLLASIAAPLHPLLASASEPGVSSLTAKDESDIDNNDKIRAVDITAVTWQSQRAAGDRHRAHSLNVTIDTKAAGKRKVDYKLSFTSGRSRYQILFANRVDGDVSLGLVHENSVDNIPIAWHDTRVNLAKGITTVSVPTTRLARTLSDGWALAWVWEKRKLHEDRADMPDQGDVIDLL